MTWQNVTLYKIDTVIISPSIALRPMKLIAIIRVYQASGVPITRVHPTLSNLAEIDPPSPIILIVNVVVCSASCDLELIQWIFPNSQGG